MDASDQQAFLKRSKKEYSEPAKALDVSTEMLSASEKYAALESADDPEWAPFSPDARETVRSLRLLGSQPAHPVILAALTKMTVAETERLLRLPEVIVVRYALIAGGNTGRFETSCAVLSRMIWMGEYRQPVMRLLISGTFIRQIRNFRARFRSSRKVTTRRPYISCDE